LEEEDEIDLQTAPGPAYQQPAHQQAAGGEIWMSNKFEIEWSSCLRNEPTHMAANVIRMQPGPTQIGRKDIKGRRGYAEHKGPTQICRT
jgi:hypothetical protein